MSVFKNGFGTTLIPMGKWVNSTAHPPMPKHLARMPKLENYTSEYQPKYELAPREWISLPVTESTTVNTRRDWFRVMFWNIMTDSWTLHASRPQRSARTVAELEAKKDEEEQPFLPPFRTDPVASIRPMIPQQSIDWDHRSCKIVDEILYHDPDILLLNEVNRVHFNQSLWKMLRMQGYGALYVSSRHLKPLTSRSQNIREGPDAKNPHVGELDYEQDIGNAIFYHKGRFFPYFMPGLESPKHIPYLHIAGLRDRATNMTAMCAVIQFTAGDDSKAVAAREWEAAGALRVIEGMNRDTSDRGFSGLVIAGDFNNTDPDEPCVAMFRERFFSAYDSVGGTRWTTWYHTDPAQPWVAPRHLHPTWEKRNFAPSLSERRQIADEAKAKMKARAANKRITDGTNAPQGPSRQDAPALIAADAGSSATVPEPPAGEDNTTRQPDDALSALSEFALEEKRHMLELRKQGVVKRSSDFLFFDSSIITTLRVLDTPSDDTIDPKVLLPNDKIPSHHVPLVVDMCWNDFAPPPVQREKGERK